MTTKSQGNLDKAAVAKLKESWGDCIRFPQLFNSTAAEEGLRWIYSLSGQPSPEIIYATSLEECRYITGKMAKKTLEEDNSSRMLHSRISHVPIELSILNALTDQTTRERAKTVSTELFELNRQRLAVAALLRGPQPAFSETIMRAPQLGGLALYAMMMKHRTTESKCLRNIEAFIAFTFLSGVFMGILGKKYAVLGLTPQYVKTNRAGHLHCPDGPAARWPHGSEIFALNGVVVPEYIVTTPPMELDPKCILAEHNAEVRREIVKRIGIERVIQRLPARRLDDWGDYRLLEIDINDRFKPRYLKMLNPSIGVWHLEGVPPDIQTCREALAWRDGENQYVTPKELT